MIGRADERARAGRRERRAAQSSAGAGPQRNPQPERGSRSRAPRGPHPHSAGQCRVFPVRGAAADWTEQDLEGVATSTEEPARPRAPRSRGPGPVTDQRRKGERQRRRRRRRGSSGDTMSSPSPGKRRMDTDVVKLYPSWRGDSGCTWGAVWGCPGHPLKPKRGPWGTTGHCPRLPPSFQCLRRLLGTSHDREPFQLPFICSTPKRAFFLALPAPPVLMTFHHDVWTP